LIVLHVLQPFGPKQEEEEGFCLLDMALIDCSARFATVWA
jgi:hypothetical protein